MHTYSRDTLVSGEYEIPSLVSPCALYSWHSRKSGEMSGRDGNGLIGWGRVVAEKGRLSEHCVGPCREVSK